MVKQVRLFIGVIVAMGGGLMNESLWATDFPVASLGPRALIVASSSVPAAEENDQKSLNSIFTLLGVPPDLVAESSMTKPLLSAYDALVVPYAAAKTLNRSSVEHVLKRVRAGALLLTDGDSPLSRALDFSVSVASPIVQIRDASEPALPIHWADAPAASFITHGPRWIKTIYYTDGASHPLFVSGRWGKGRVLFSAPLIDPLTPDGYTRFPEIPRFLMEVGIHTAFRAQRAEVYFDPSLRKDVAIETLARLWRQWGVRIVYASSWEAPYDYDRLIRAAHSNGVRVYAWLEWPHVSYAFWNDHPVWREQTATGVDAHVDWRFLMNLQNPECLRAALKDLRSLLQSHAWDGVNIGEIYFEPVDGLINAKDVTPMDADVRRRFQAAFHFDPIELFRKTSSHFWRRDPAGMNQFFQFRKTLSAELLERVLTEISTLNDATRDWEVIVTAIDVASDAQLADHIGNDMQASIDLSRRFGASLQIEDPFSAWQNPPERYAALAHLFARRFHVTPAIFDVNIVHSHPADQVGFPTESPTGTELFQLWRVAAGVVPRVCFYAEQTFHPADWPVMPYVMASLGKVRLEKAIVDVKLPYAAQLEWNSQKWQVLLDHGKVPCRGDGVVWIPSGVHHLSLSKSARHASANAPILRAAACDVEACEQNGREINLTYNSVGRCIFLIDAKPSSFQIDARPPATGLVADSFLIAPGGRHQISVRH